MKNLTAILLMSTGVLFANLNSEETKNSSIVTEHQTNSIESVNGGNNGWDDE